MSPERVSLFAGVVALSLGLLVSCSLKPAEQPADHRVERLFTHDGCTVYRFRDRGFDHYFARCETGQVETVSPQPVLCGAACLASRDERIRTLGGKDG